MSTLRARSASSAPARSAISRTSSRSLITEPLLRPRPAARARARRRGGQHYRQKSWQEQITITPSGQLLENPGEPGRGLASGHGGRATFQPPNHKTELRCKLGGMAVFWIRRLVLAWSVSGCVIVTERPIDSAPPPAAQAAPERKLAEAPETKPAATPAEAPPAPAPPEGAPAPERQPEAPPPAQAAPLPAPAL